MSIALYVKEINCSSHYSTYVTMLQEKLNQTFQLLPPLFVLSFGRLALDEFVDSIDKLDTVEELLSFF